MNVIKNYFAHIVTYLTGLYAFVSHVDPALLPPQLTPYIAVAGAVAAAVHHKVAAPAATDGLPAPAAGTIVKALAFFIMAGVAVFGTASLTSCATTPTASQQAAATVAIDLAAGYAIQQHSSDPAEWKARAVSYKAIAVSLKAINDKGSASLDSLAADLRPLIAKLTPADQLAANALVAAITPYLQERIDANPNLATTQAAVAQILQTVIDACNSYGA